MPNGAELIEEARKLAEDREVPDRVTNRLNWALAVDAFHHRKDLEERIEALEVAFIRRAAFWGALGGIGAAVAAILLVLPR